MTILEKVEHVIGAISGTVWPIFLPLVMIVGLFLIIRTFTVIQPQTSKPSKVDAAHIVGPAVISLGAMIGTGAIIGVLDSNPLKVDGDKIKDIVVLETIKEGKTIYSA